MNNQKTNSDNKEDFNDSTPRNDVFIPCVIPSLQEINPKPEHTGSVKDFDKSSHYSKPIDGSYKLPKESWIETRQAWCIGHVQEINYEASYFTAHLRDVLNSVESIAEFNFSTAFGIQNNPEEINQYLFEGAEFAFIVYTKHGRGAPETVSKIEFSSPYIWQDEDYEKTEKLYNELFPNDQ